MAPRQTVIGTGTARLPGMNMRGADLSPAVRFFTTSAGRIGSRVMLIALILLAWGVGSFAIALKVFRWER